MGRKLPIGIQAFEKLRNNGYIYVDKTEYIYRLVHDNVPYFLSRPRRFGKSLLLSTIKAYWEGRKDLFEGLAIEQLENDNPDAWKSYPVFYFDFNGVNYQEEGALERALDFRLMQWEEEYGLTRTENTLGERFQILLKKVSTNTGMRCVILIDEYDKPLLDVMENQRLMEHNREVFKGFFSTLKSFDEYIQFIFITGVSKFHKVSIFSDLNQLKDISLTKKYSALCGLTDEELHRYFQLEIGELAKEQDMTEPECLAALKRTYDGYYFHPNGLGVYNPYSLLNAFSDGEFGSYWFETGTPTFLVKRLKEMEFDVRKFTDYTLFASEGMLKDYTSDNLDPVPLLYQTGYLTIAGYDRIGRQYTLAFPNEEVKFGFIECLMPAYIADIGAGSGKDIFTLRRYVEQGKLDNIRDIFSALFASITYT